MSQTSAASQSANPGQVSSAGIRIENLSKTFVTSKGSEVRAIQELDLTIEMNEFLVIVGPSGCGKSTLLRILGGLDTPSTGAATFNGVVENRPLTSMVFQGDSIFPWLTVRENIGYGLMLQGEKKNKIKERVDLYMEKVGLAARFGGAFPHQLSGGMRQRVSIARAFVNSPQVLLMDEPFSALDEQNKVILQEELLRLWDEDGKTVVFITHSVDEAVTMADRIMVMTSGPGQCKALLDVPFSRPRNVLEMRASSEYAHFVGDIWGHLRDEVRKARAMEDG